MLIIGATPVSAQTYRPDAEGYPCARTSQLVVVQSETGFSIREKTERVVPATAAPAPTPTAIKLGNSFTFDRGIFSRTSLVYPELSDASQR
ncbi:hypothetical protein HL653_12260 [Sphingomonas sp. AP4-R1]|uniref:hypothetical protein n=1 Tax=Sphingomonas sp. AP4-R1 TaxID=2735134 RepID=UPI001493AB47|nr:hypothetical protein [Sphingomonas sp. AP4-R1]QJU58439.1 hypothetical protein HL653_12260 [Sphingomonas sp. AP4-R1]